MAGVAAAAIVAATGALVRLHTLATGRRPVRDAVSDYGAGRHRGFYRAMVVALGAGALLLAGGLARATDVATGGLVWLAVYGVARIAIAFYPTDLPGAPATVTGRIHLALAAAAFTSIAFAAAKVGGDLAGEPGWHGIGTVLQLLGIVVAACAAATLAAAVAPRARRAFGAVERALYATSMAWLLVTAVALVVKAA